MPHVEILLGSPSDLHFLWDSEFPVRLEKEGIRYKVSACSAHRNPVQLADRINQSMEGTAVYVCAAGWAAALPGAVKAHLLGRSLAKVYGIALPSEEYPDGMDAEISIRRLPPGIDVIYGGVGIEGFNSIAEQVCTDVLEFRLIPDPEQLEKIRAKIKPPIFDIPRPREET